MSPTSSSFARAAFTQAFGHAPTGVAFAPGRVNLIGEHTDYNQGFVLPAAIDPGTWVAFRQTGDEPTLTVVAQDFDQQCVSVPLQARQSPDAEAPWSDYLRGVIVELKKRGYQLAPGELLITGNIPSGAGLSSSASLELALIRALLAMSGESIEPTDAALVGQTAENDFVGCACGIMDQLISARGKRNQALLIDCRDLSSQTVAMPADWRILIVHSGVRRGLVDSEYNQRRQQCEAAAAHFGLDSLRDLKLATLNEARADLPEQVYRRARHVLTENARTVKAAAAMKEGKLDRLIKAMLDSHASMRDDFAITTPEIDTLVQLIEQAGQGQAGARMTGGGFGGCVIAIAPSAVIPQLITAVEADYERLTGCHPLIIEVSASAGAFSTPISYAESSAGAPT
ncbi:galactokinase [Natronospirillum operosum]|uniref:Galactokinase n=1 Tax=Natronospirillum operosum TaxID=2759953 RepID=A0A4Z0WHS2_9GAMM|nr:galactokinase [Natronospirillum operosum]TGG95467.1 galactokinase [Natronospirillum operosum]